MFFKVILFFRAFSFFFFFFPSKTGSKAISRVARALELPAKCARRKLQSHIFIYRLLRLPRDFFTTKSFSRKLLSFSGPFHDCITSTSLLPYNPRKTCVFSFYVANVTYFQNHFTSLTKSLEPPSTQISLFFKTPSLSSLFSAFPISRYDF